MVSQISAPCLKGHRVPLSLRDAEDLLAERSIVGSFETIRAWVGEFGT
jgi:putative transposase